jgi:hypothetical protein
MHDRVFIPQSSTDSFGINFDVHEDDYSVDFDYASRGAVSITTRVGVSAEDPTGTVGAATARINVTFGREHALVFSCVGCVQHRVRDVLSLQEEIWGRYRAGLWREEWVVITHITVAQSATILIADAKGAEIDFQAVGDLGGSGIRLGDVSLGLSATSVKAVSNRWVAAQGLTPMFLAIGIQRGLLGAPHLRPLKRGVDQPDGVQPAEALDERFSYYDYPVS